MNWSSNRRQYVSVFTILTPWTGRMLLWILPKNKTGKADVGRCLFLSPQRQRQKEDEERQKKEADLRYT